MLAFLLFSCNRYQPQKGDPQKSQPEIPWDTGAGPMVGRSTVPDGYERAIDHFEFDLKGNASGHVDWGSCCQKLGGVPFNLPPTLMLTKSGTEWLNYIVTS